MPPPLTMIAGARDLTPFLGGCVLSNTDPGGYEILQARPDALRDLTPGAPIAVRYGLDWVWDGIVNEPSQHDRGGRVEAAIAGVGKRALLRRDTYRENYVDRDLTRWGPMSVQRQINYIAGGYAPSDPSVLPDATSGVPSVLERFNGQWDGVTGRPVVEAFYDAAGIPIGSIYYTWTKGLNVGAADVNWGWGVVLSVDDVASTIDNSGNLRAAGVGSGTLTATASNRIFACLQHYYSLNAAGTYGAINTPYDIFWSYVAVYGNHGLTKRGIDPKGFYTSDIATDALTRSGVPLDITTGDASAYTLGHCTYLTDTFFEQVPLDMADLMGWHFGIWEPRTIFGTTPQALFIPPPTDATCIVRRADCDEVVEPSIRYDKLYDTCKVAYTDTATGRPATVTVTQTNPLAQQYGVDAGTLLLTAGLSSSGAATSLGTFALQLSQQSARGSGSATLPQMVSLPMGGSKPSILLKAGRDRLRISDLPTVGSSLAVGTNRFDTFLIRRVETTVDEHSVPRTRVDFDTGSDLLAVLVARLAVAATIAG